MKVLITGSEGFVARGFRRLLKNHEIVGVDIKEPTFEGGVKMDCRDFFKICTMKFDLVIHTAAIVGGREMIENEPLAIGSDLSIDAEMFNWAVKTNQPKVVYFSSSAAYPVILQKEEYKLKESNIDLEELFMPDVMYGWTKITGEMLAAAARKKGVKVYVFRPFSGYGADQDLTYPFPSFIKRAKEKQDPFEIWGDGEQVRDFIHIDDITTAVMTVVASDIQKPVNLGTGVPTSFNELAKIICEEFGYSPKFKHHLDKPTGVFYRCADTEYMEGIYKPKISLREGVRLCK